MPEGELETLFFDLRRCAPQVAGGPSWLVWFAVSSQIVMLQGSFRMIANLKTWKEGLQVASEIPMHSNANFKTKETKVGCTATLV